MASSAASSNLSPLSVVFDDLMRHYDMCVQHDTTTDFLEFVKNQEDCRAKWNAAEKECQRLQSEIQNKDEELNRMQKKIEEVRKHLEGKMELLNKVELEKDRVVLRNTSAKTLIKSYLKESKLGNEYKDRLQNLLSVLENADRGGTMMSKSPGMGLDTISEDGTTDLSMTQSEDDLDLSVTRGRRRSKRPSLTKEDMLIKRSRASRDAHNNSEQLIAKTVVSFPKDGPIHAVATLETSYPASALNNKKSEAFRPSAPPLPTSESESDAVGGWVALEKAAKSSPAVLTDNRRASNQFVPSTSTQSPRFGRTLSSGGPMTMRPHAFCQKTVIKPEMCEPCGKRIKFSKPAYKCRDCKATCHPECKDKVPLPCVSTGTPSNNKRQMGALADYVPAHHPMVPALIQHCVNEIEIRGLDTVGLYRIPGPEREVKELKERFLRGKGAPNLGPYDIHVICGCVKDFLRSLQEPLVSRWMWRDFALAVEFNDPIKRQQEVERIVQEDLPPPNQDTLAFVILHLQRVAESPEVKMPIDNLSKVFGPTIVGYSTTDVTGPEMLKETKTQQKIVQSLLTLPGEFWKKFAYRSDEGQIYNSGKGSHRSKARTLASPYTPQGHPAALSIASRGDRSSNAKKLYFTDDSPQGVKTRSQKRTFFE